MRNIIIQAMQDCDHWVVEFEYCDARGHRTRRVVSPIRFMGKDRFLGLCLGREAPRQFSLDRCQGIRLSPAHQFVMPVAMAV